MNLIELEDVGLTFRLRRHGRISFKDYFVNGLFFRRRETNTVEFPVLEGINFRVAEGQRVGIIGRNGAGKSTLLKLIAGIYPATKGRRTVYGRISSLFDLTLGFELDGTGWENIMYRGYLQGESRRSIRGKMEEIAEFSELGSFLDTPVRYYSAGMLVRLAFSIATAIEPEILIIDEALAAGDLDFQNKARKRIRGLISTARAVVIVSHDLQTLQLLCDHLIWLDHGHIHMEGATREVIEAYQRPITDNSQMKAA